MNEPSIELIKALKTLREEIPLEQFNNILSGLGIDSNNFEERIKGLEREYEFISNLYICNLCKEIIPIDEEFTTNIKEKSCDAIVILKNDEKILVEVKTTLKDNYKISQGNFRNKVEWANRIGYKLYFAINIFNFWGLYSAEQVKEWNCKVGIDNIQESLLSKVFGTLYYVSTNKIRFVSTYIGNTTCDNLGIKDGETNSNLIKEEFYVNDIKVKEVTPYNSNELPLVLLSSEIRSRCNRENKKINEFETRTIYELNNVNIFCSFDLITTTISEMEGPTLKYKYNSFLKMISKNENRDKINIWLKELIKTLKMEPFILLPTSMNNKLKCK